MRCLQDCGLTFEFWDVEKVGADNFLGTCFTSLSHLFRREWETKVVKDRFPISDPEGRINSSLVAKATARLNDTMIGDGNPYGHLHLKVAYRSFCAPSQNNVLASVDVELHGSKGFTAHQMSLDSLGSVLILQAGAAANASVVLVELDERTVRLAHLPGRSVPLSCYHPSACVGIYARARNLINVLLRLVG
eukprot:SAG11_NODE_12_length_27025_cov_37.402681_3_plen_191_part_00